MQVQKEEPSAVEVLHSCFGFEYEATDTFLLFFEMKQFLIYPLHPASES